MVYFLSQNLIKSCGRENSVGSGRIVMNFAEVSTALLPRRSLNSISRDLFKPKVSGLDTRRDFTLRRNVDVWNQLLEAVFTKMSIYEIFVTGCTASCQNGEFLFQCWKTKCKLDACDVLWWPLQGLLLAPYHNFRSLQAIYEDREPSQWETALLCNDVSHWLGANPESDVVYIYDQSGDQWPNTSTHWPLGNLNESIMNVS